MNTEGIFSKLFWQRTVERMIRAFAAANVITADLKGKLLASLGVAIVSLLFSLVGSQIGDSESPSIVK